MATELTKAILIEIVDMLQTINQTILELSDDILRDETVLNECSDIDQEELEANEVTYWSNLYIRTATSLQKARVHNQELETRVRQLENQLFKTMM